jgi:undecaprenyl-phosphate 4-deoxy-4-formamido-L-arabinose transferase
MLMPGDRSEAETSSSEAHQPHEGRPGEAQTFSSEAQQPDERRPGLSIVIPLYRDQDALREIFARCAPILEEQAEGGELVLVDDGGLDLTTPRALELARGFTHPTTVVRLTRNFGQHPATYAGLEHARGERVVTLDSDLQYPPEEIPKLLAELSPEHPVVSGYRAERRDPLPRRLITRGLTRWLNAQTGVELHDFGSMFRAYDRPTVELMMRFTERHRYVPAVVAWLGVSIKEVPILHAPRGERGSRYRLSGLIEMVLDLVTGYTVFPLRILSLLGSIAALVGFTCTFAFLVYRVAVGGGVSGTVSAFGLVFALLGMQLLLLALMGEYIGRIYSEAKGRPYFVVAGAFRVDGRPELAPAREATEAPVHPEAKTAASSHAKTAASTPAKTAASSDARPPGPAEETSAGAPAKELA